MSKMTKPLSVRLHQVLRSSFVNSSENLYRFAGRAKYPKQHYRIYRDSDGDLFIGFIDDTECFCGTKLIKVACGNFGTFAFALNDPEDVTEWFINEYKDKGMCAYTDMRHQWEQGNHEEKLPDGSRRKCMHCGKVEYLKSRMVRKTWWESSND